MKRTRLQRGLYVTESVLAETRDEQLEAWASVKVGQAALDANLETMLQGCRQAESTTHAQQADELTREIEFFRAVFARREVADPAWYVVLAMKIASEYEMLRANVHLEKAARAGWGTMKGGRRNAGDHSQLEAWARAEVANKRPIRGLAARAVRARVTRLTERQVLTHLKGCGILQPSRTPNRK